MTPPPSRLSEERRAELEKAATALVKCGQAWEPEVRILGNVTAADLADVCTHYLSMARELREANERVSALEQLVVCYRVGKRPSEKLLAELDRTRKALEET
jgi:hypothetical protein